MRQDIKLKGKLKGYTQTPLMLTLLFAAMDVWMYVLNVKAGILGTIFVAIYFFVMLFVYWRNQPILLNELIDSDVRMFVLGGCVNSSEYDMEGHLTVEALKHFCVDIAFICAGGITKENGVSDYNCEVAQVNKAILSRARKTVLVAHAKKFGADSFSVTCPLDSIHTIISDSTLSQGYVRCLQEKGIELILADVGQV